MTSRKQPGVAFWATVVMVAGLAYVLSSGPVIWLYQHGAIPGWAVSAVELTYGPLDWFMHEAADSFTTPIWWYWDLWDWKL